MQIIGKAQPTQQAPYVQSPSGAGQSGENSNEGHVEVIFGDSGASSAYANELNKHFIIPPGFEDFEPFEMSFELRNGKVYYINPRGSEPLVLYAAFKNSIMNADHGKRNGQYIIQIK